ncbi:MAG: cytochrome c family protein [Acidobacteriota bacterium]|nr:cytochrome c family protein [Acidobacteriota bacterium]
MLWCAVSASSAAAPPPEQPIPFSHQEHAGNLKIKCKMCHPNPDPGEVMTLPAASVCMQCHSAIQANSPAIRKLAVFARNDREIPWARVYEIPTYVKFSHRAHLESGNTCQECHGPVEQRAQLSKEGDTSMGGCMNCHRLKKASIDCGFCHEPRQ